MRCTTRSPTTEPVSGACQIFVEQLAWRIGELARRCRCSRERTGREGLATRQGDFVAASRAALELDQLWPLAL